MQGYQLTATQMAAIRDTVRTVMNQFRGGMTGKTFQQVQRPLTVVLDADIAAASNAATTPATVPASLIAKAESGDLYDTNETVTVVNRWEHIALSSGTLCVVTWIDGEWRITAADCEPLSASTLLSLAGS